MMGPMGPYVGPSSSLKIGAFSFSISSTPLSPSFPSSSLLISLAITMVLLHQRGSSRKRQSSFNSPFPPPKVAKPAADDASASERPPRLQQLADGVSEASALDKAAAILAEAGCTLLNPLGTPSLPSDPHKFRSYLHRTFAASSIRSDFVAGFSAYIQSPKNLRRQGFTTFSSGFLFFSFTHWVDLNCTWAIFLPILQGPYPI